MMAQTEKLNAQTNVRVRKLLWITFKNGLPCLLTIAVGYMLISNLGAGNQIIDASKWPAFAVTSTRQPSALILDAEKDSFKLSTFVKETLHGEVIRGILSVTTFLFIFLNTLIFLWQNRKSKAADWRLSAVWIVTIVCELATFSWILKLYLGWNADSIISFSDETMALSIFSLFSLVDCVNWRIFADPRSSPISMEESKFALNQALYVDLPVVVGIFVALCLARHLSQRFNDSEYYLSGFFSGAAVMHLAASQIIYSILAFRKDFSIERIRP